MWDRYCRGADAILYAPPDDMVHKLTNRYVVDAADVSFCLSTQIQRLKLTRQTKSLPTATSELHALLGLPSLQSVPLLVLANKNDLPGAIGVDDLIKEMRLGEIGGRVVSVSLSPKPL
jgi:ADP-ribosylation factor-like protein 8